MKTKKREHRKTSATVVPAHDSSSRFYFYAMAAAALIVAFWAYSPVFNGPFLFDDTVLPPARLGLDQPLSWYLHEIRPMVMFTYWLNYTLSGRAPFGYHLLSLLFHLVTSSLVFLIVRRLLSWSGVDESRRPLIAGFAAAIYLLHPAQSESVAYISGRFEALSVMFAYAAFAVFLLRPGPVVTWARAVAILGLFGLALASKEHTIALPALLLLTDYWWNPGFSFKGIRGNWRVYAPLALGALAGLVFFWQLILHSPSAGFGLNDLRWYEYLFTQFRALFVYLEMFVLPVRLTADWDFPISRTILQHGSIFGLAVLLALVAAAWWYRRRFPLATYGFFVFLLLMAPTSSILPIKDPIAERRIYFSILGLLLIVADVLARVKIERRVLAWCAVAVALLAAIGTHARAQVWSSPVSLWEDTAAKSPNKSRVHQQLAQAYYDEQRYDLAVAEFQKSAQLELPDYNMLVNWGLAYQGVGALDQALAKFRQAAALEPTAHVYSQIGMIYVQRRQPTEALEALATAEKLDPSWAYTYNYRAKLYFQANQLPEAIVQYRRALALNPQLADAREELRRAEAQLIARPR
jgi:protein O-mannosyl-transferase